MGTGTQALCIVTVGLITEMVQSDWRPAYLDVSYSTVDTAMTLVLSTKHGAVLNSIMLLNTCRNKLWEQESHHK